MTFFPDEKHLQKTGTLGRQERQRINIDSFHVIKNESSNFSTKELNGITYDRLEGNLFTNQHRFPIHDDIEMIDLETFSVYRNGESLQKNTDYELRRVTKQLGELCLTKAITENDDDIIIRYKYLSNSVLTAILLLPRSGLTDEELASLLPSKVDLFNVSKLVKWNPKLNLYTETQALARDCKITEEGIVGDLVII